MDTDTPRQLDITNLAERLEIEVKHIGELVDQKIETLRSLLSQRADFFEASSTKDVAAIDFKVTETLQEIRGYKDVLSQQLVLLDNSLKIAHRRLDELDKKNDDENSTFLSLKRDIERLELRIDTALKGLTSSQTTLEATIGEIKEDVDVLKQKNQKEEILKQAKKEDPIRRFFREYGKETLVAVLTFLVAYLISNLDTVLEFVKTAFGG